MDKILIIYFSGAGSTKKIAEILYDNLRKNYSADIFSVEDNDKFDINSYDALVIGTPVYHGAPSKILTEYINSIRPLERKIPAFIYNTRGLGSYNTNRILGKLLENKNIITVLDKEYTAPASDVSLIMQSVKRFFRFEKDIEEKVKTDCKFFEEYIKNKTKKGYISRFRFSSIINAPNKFVGERITFNIYVHEEKCSKCRKCIKDCPTDSLIENADGYPVFKKETCINCYRCIHHCNEKALSLNKNKTPEKTFNSLYK